MKQQFLSWLVAMCLGCAGTSVPSQAPFSQTAESQTAKPRAQAVQRSTVVAIPNAKEPLPGVLTGGAPSEANLREAKAHGYRTVISLLSASESADEKTWASELGLRFVSIPIGSAADLTEENARRLGQVLAEPSHRPLILHCASGNRAGALLALEAFYVEGKSAESALELGTAAGLSKLRPAVEERLVR